ncbi:MAG: Transcription initiation factor TFIID subunit 9 [Trizodia sp. TS-e1964]|nr:MAG: Transcription initiation factor TFIID subunit 9 [Trizodia sp. TS-e1964]
MADTNHASPAAAPTGSPQAQPAVIPTASQPPTSLTDSGLSKRPRDARLIHLILAGYGITAYQERVPLQLLDFAYRYTSTILQDAMHLSAENTGRGANSGEANVTISSLRLAISGRLNFQFKSALPKEWWMDQAAERNRVALPPIGRDWGVRLPPERFCLTGVNWALKEDWESEGEEDVDMMDLGEKQAGEVDGLGEGDAEGEQYEDMDGLFADAPEEQDGDEEMNDE